VNRNFRDILAALSVEGAEFLVVGAYALAVHGLPRATGDLDIWVRPTDANARRVWQALLRFGAPLASMDAMDFQSPDIVFRMGLPPSQVDILTSISGLSFDEAWPNRVEYDLEGIRVFVISRGDQIRNKRRTDRPKDKLDADWLERNAPPAAAND
jgi:hypothetical protein